MSPSEEVHFRILRAIELDPGITQRDLAQLLGVSKGKTHYLLAALVGKGLLKIGHFGRTDGKLGKVTYLLTPEGIKNRAALTRSYLARKEAEYEALWAEIKGLRNAELEVPAELKPTSERRSG